MSCVVDATAALALPVKPNKRVDGRPRNVTIWGGSKNLAAVTTHVVIQARKNDSCNRQYGHGCRIWTNDVPFAHAYSPIHPSMFNLKLILDRDSGFHDLIDGLEENNYCATKYL
jgi:hypothetical protein